MAGAGGIAEYEVGVPIREGWGGTIRDGRYRRSGRRVTIQEVRPDLTAAPGLVERLGDVGRDAAALRDPHLLAVYDLVSDAGAFRLIGEWSDGTTIAAKLARGPMPPVVAIAAVCDVLSGLEALHTRGLFHGQVGPETIVVDSDGHARLGELALCAAASPPGFGTRTDVRDAARLGLHLLRKAGSRFDPVRRPLDGASTGAGAGEAAGLRAEVDRAAAALLGPSWRAAVGATSRRDRRATRRPGRAFAVAALAVLILAAAAAAVILVAGRGGKGASSTGPLTVGSDASLVVTPVTGGCNTTYAFVGTGLLSGTGKLVYRWEQSDGQVSADTVLPISADEGSFRLTQAWRLQGSQKVDGAMTLHILKPVDRKLSQTFHYTCQ
ncbi:MAG: hypothetical protein M3Z57_03065 [Candidatus Dormibacteraeota bacterium]|nr:hypothetical protein [Candidatus Dormibacteraeota bacterium]